MKALPVGKLPTSLLVEMLSEAPQTDPDIVIGPGVGFDCAVVNIGEHHLVLKSDPITFVSDDLGWYLVHVNVNDLATTGARPRWMLITLLLPEESTDRATVLQITGRIYDVCRELGIAVIGGHTEVTYGLSRAIAVGTLIGEVRPEQLIRPDGMQAGDKILLTKGVPIEATSILAREFAPKLAATLSESDIARAAGYLYDPGISVLQDATIALGAGRVTAMHDPTEGGLAAALWELAEAGDKALIVHRDTIPVPALSRKVCTALNIDPLAAIASGALLLTVAESDVDAVLAALAQELIDCALIGEVHSGPAAVWQQAGGERSLMERPQRDAVAVLFER